MAYTHQASRGTTGLPESGRWRISQKGQRPALAGRPSLIGQWQSIGIVELRRRSGHSLLAIR
jgi:hypothetical protein